MEPGPLQVQQRCLLLENSESLDLPSQSDRLYFIYLFSFSIIVIMYFIEHSVVFLHIVIDFS